MALRFLMSGGNFIFSAGISAAGIWNSAAGSITNSAPSGRINNFAFTNAAVTPEYITPNLGGNFTSIYAGAAYYLSATQNNDPIIAFLDQNGNAQCDVRMNGTGQLFFTRQGTPIGSVSTYALTTGVWSYIEFHAVLSTAGAGTCEVRVNGITVLTSSGLTNASTSLGASAVNFIAPGLGVSTYVTDFYVVDGISGANVSYLGDISVVELYADGAGVNATWTPNVGPFSITSVANASGGNTVYSGSIPAGASNALEGYNFVPSGFAQSPNNAGGSNPAYFTCVASSATSITLNNPNGVTDTSGSVAFQCIVQTGAINQEGNRPNGDIAYIGSNTPGQISDFAHTPLVLTGLVLGVCQQSYLRKDNTGLREVAQTCLSGGSSELGATIALGTTYQFYQNILE
ncbi:MAG: hypothetical protein WAK21_12940, partial [Candidatus Sulfotelmatobacter sp.]